MSVALARAGHFFCYRLRSHNRMDPDLEDIIRQALKDFLAAGFDYIGQTLLVFQWAVSSA